MTRSILDTQSAPFFEPGSEGDSICTTGSVAGLWQVSTTCSS